MTKRKVYTTNLIIVLGFIVIFFLTGKVWWLIPSAFVLVSSLLRFSFAEKIAITWMRIGKTIGNFNARILLGVVYLMIVVPTALLKRKSSKSTPVQHTNWIKVKESSAIDFTKPF